MVHRDEDAECPGPAWMDDHVVEVGEPFGHFTKLLSEEGVTGDVDADGGRVTAHDFDNASHDRRQQAADNSWSMDAGNGGECGRGRLLVRARGSPTARSLGTLTCNGEAGGGLSRGPATATRPGSFPRPVRVRADIEGPTPPAATRLACSTGCTVGQHLGVAPRHRSCSPTVSPGAAKRHFAAANIIPKSRYGSIPDRCPGASAARYPAIRP